MKTFSEITEAKEDSSRKPFRLVVLADRPKTIKENASSTKLIKARKLEGKRLDVYNCRERCLCFA